MLRRTPLGKNLLIPPGKQTGYDPGKTYDETLYEGNVEDYAHITLDNKAQVTGRVTAAGGGGFSGVSVQAEGKNCKTTTGSSGDYTLKLPPGRSGRAGQLERLQDQILSES